MTSTAHGESDGGTGSEMGCYVCLLACVYCFFFSFFSQSSRAGNMFFELYRTGALLSGLYSMLLDEPSKAFMGVTFAFGF